MKIALIHGAGNNCGDHLIAERARLLFKHFMPQAKLFLLNRTMEWSDEMLGRLHEVDLVVLAGGPLLRSDAAESMHLATLIADGLLDSVKAPFVVMGAGVQFKAPFDLPRALNPTVATRRLFQRLEDSPYWSGTRDFDSVVQMRGWGYRNFHFTGCPALYRLDMLDAPFVPFVSSNIHRVAFSIGSPWLMSEASLRQHLQVLDALVARFPSAEFVVASHHKCDGDCFKAQYGREVPPNWIRLMKECKVRGLEPHDISGGLEKMTALYENVDLHVGYRVHAHVLQTSSRRQSLLIAEDGRASGMSDIILGPVYRAWKWMLDMPDFRGKSRIVPRIYDADLSARIVSDIGAYDGKCPLNMTLPAFGLHLMSSWFSQFGVGECH